MKNPLIILFTVLSLTACVSSGSPWDRGGYARPAETAPRALQPESEENINGTHQQENEQTALYSSAVPPSGANRPEYEYGQQQQPDTVPTLQTAPVLPPVKVALLVPLSGPHANLGEALLQAAQLALFDVHYDSFELIPRDTKGTPEGARQAAQDALNAGAQIVLGPLFAESVRAAKTVTNRHNINMLAFSTNWTLANSNTYIMGFLPFSQVQRIALYARQNNLNKIGILAPNDDYGNAVISAYNSLAYRTHAPTADVMRYPVDESDISGLIRSFTHYDDRVEALNQKIRPLEDWLAQNPGDKKAQAELAALKNGNDDSIEPPFDAILLATGGGQARSIANLLSYYDLEPEQVKRLGTGLWDDAGLATEPGMQDAWFAAPDPRARDEFEIRFNQTYGYMPPRLATLAYDATALTAIIARTSYQNYGRPVFDSRMISNPNGFSGIDGIFRFGPNGMIERGLAVLEIKNGVTSVIDPAPVTFQQTLQTY